MQEDIPNSDTGEEGQNGPQNHDGQDSQNDSGDTSAGPVNGADGNGSGGAGGDGGAVTPPPPPSDGTELIDISDELKQSYLDYAMSVIVGRALPDVRDGLKPVHKRILFAMEKLSNYYNRPYKKSARIVGDVIGKYHPHGDTAVYDALVRMAQDFSLRYMLVEGQGNFGSMDGDSPAAMRYTEVRLRRITNLMLDDLDKDTVDTQLNYDDTEQIPLVLPARIPNLLMNGSDGIAVGMATKIPPHNINEVIDAHLAMLENPNILVSELREHIKGPDFPTGAIINGVGGIGSAYETGRGSIKVRARAEVVAQGNKEQIIVSELPYQVNKARLIERIAEAVRDKRIVGISEIRDESDKSGVRVVIDIKRGESGEIVLNNLYRQTQMEDSYGINMVALHEGRPKLLNLFQIIKAFLDHRREVVTRRTRFLLRRERERGHNLEGLAVALSNIDEIIAIIRASADRRAAMQALRSKPWRLGDVAPMLQRAGFDACRPQGEEYEGAVLISIESLEAKSVESVDELGPDSGYVLSDKQATAITDMRLHQLTALERDQLQTNYGKVLDTIVGLTEILESQDRLTQVIRDELIEIKEAFGDERRTELQHDVLDLTNADLVPPEVRILALSDKGYIKSQALSDYRSQSRGGVGRNSAQLREEDFIKQTIVAHTHEDSILFFTNFGKVYRISTLEIPRMGYNSVGIPMVRIINQLDKDHNEKVATMLPVRDFDETRYLVMATRLGKVIKVSLKEFVNINRNGKIALRLQENDSLVDAVLSSGDNDYILATSTGKAIRFHEGGVRSLRRGAMGVRGVKMPAGVSVVALLTADDKRQALFVTENGYGKRTPFSDFPLKKNRGGMGVIGIKASARNGSVIDVLSCQGDEDLVLVADSGKLVRIPVAQIREIGRNTQGVSLVRLSDKTKLVRAVVVEGYISEEDEEDDNLQAGEDSRNKTPIPSETSGDDSENDSEH